MRTIVRGLLSLLILIAIFAAATWGVVAFLNGRDKVPATNSCTAVLPDGSSFALTAEQADSAALIAAISAQRVMPARAATIALATAMQESSLRNIDYGDRDSLGLFQQRPSTGWGTEEQIMDPVYSTNAFYDQLAHLDGYEDMEITVAAQRIQLSAYPDHYAQHENMARAFASALRGHSTAALTCDLDTADGDLGTFLDRLERDFGSQASETDGDELVVDAAAVLPDYETAIADWTIGQWAVATASVTGIEGVRVGDQEWVRGTRAWVAAESPAPEGSVIVW